MRVNNHREHKTDEILNEVNQSLESQQIQHASAHSSQIQAQNISKQSSIKMPSGSQSQRDQQHSVEGDNTGLDNFAMEEIPSKMIMVDPTNHKDINLIVYHSGKNIDLVILIYRGSVRCKKASDWCG